MFVSVSPWKNSMSMEKLNVNAVVGGVGMLLSPRAIKSLKNIEKMQPRITVATFNVNLGTTIISCYSPTACGETDLNTF